MERRQCRGACFLEPAHYEVAAATTQRNRWFADSLLEGDGFELPVREHFSFVFGENDLEG
jgi:hypothetical protein